MGGTKGDFILHRAFPLQSANYSSFSLYQQYSWERGRKCSKKRRMGGKHARIQWRRSASWQRTARTRFADLQ